jgi:leucine efflux protein
VFYGITDLSTFILGTIFIILLLGPNSLYVRPCFALGCRRGQSRGVRHLRRRRDPDDPFG